MVNFGVLAAEIVLLVWGTPANFNGFCFLAVLLYGTPVLGVSQTLRRWTEGATYIRQGGHHVGHWPTFLVSTCTAHCIVVVLARIFVICLGFMLFTNDNKSSCYFVIMVSVVDGANLIYIQVMACFWLWRSYFSHIAFWWLLFIYHMHVYCTAWNKIHCDRQKHDSLLSSLSCSLLICVELCHVVIVTCMNFTHTHTHTHS